MLGCSAAQSCIIVGPFALQDARKGVLFDDFPPVLQLQLKRFEYDFQRDIMVKVSNSACQLFDGSAIAFFSHCTCQHRCATIADHAHTNMRLFSKSCQSKGKSATVECTIKQLVSA